MISKIVIGSFLIFINFGLQKPSSRSPAEIKRFASKFWLAAAVFIGTICSSYFFLPP